ncbi:MAG: hypothetical protein WA821_07490, partial [Anaerolineales bacterium]
RMAAQTPEARPALLGLLPYLTAALASCADPDQALINMERFCRGGSETDRGGSETRPNNNPAAETFRQLSGNPRAVEILITIFAGSLFLTEILLRDPAQLETLTQRERLVRQKKAADYRGEALQAMQGLQPAAQLDSLRRYQRGELLRIGASDLLNLYDLPAVTAQLSNLADGMACACLEYAVHESKTPAAGFVVIALGKLGGEEVNYSSDIDLLFLAADKAGDYLGLGQRLIDALSSMTPEGFLYRVDMRLRPWGRDGALVTSLDDYMAYLNRNAMLWEKQALLKARPIAGDMALGEQALERINAVLFGADAETVRASVHAMKQRTEEILRAKGRDWGEVKLGEGSIRDVEFVVQFLQMVHGGENPKLHRRNTLRVLRRLMRAGLLTPHESRVLTDGYIFLRTIEHYLQLMHYRQTHSLPSDPGAINLLARRLGFRGQTAPEQAREHFLERYRQHSLAIRAIYTKYVGGVETAAPESARVEPAPLAALQQHLARMEASYSATFSEEEIHRHAELADGLGEEQLVFVDPVPAGTGWRVTVVAYDYLGELSLICGLMFAHGLDIQEAQVFTYETVEKAGVESDLTATRRPRRTRSGKPVTPKAAEISTFSRRKIVDVFTVKPVNAQTPDWAQYAEDLRALTGMMQAGKRREARSELAKRVGAVFQGMGSANLRLYPIEIKIDNEISARYTVLHIQTADTVGFLYEFTNALSMTHTNILRMVVHSSGQRADDLLYVTDEDGRKITSPQKQRELRAAAVLIKHFTHLLPGSANPAQALLHFREFLTHLFEQPDWPDELASLERPEVLNNLAQILGVSDFLWDDFMRMQYANLFPMVSDANALNSAKPRGQLQSELNAALAVVHSGPEAPREDAPWRKVLNEFKDREMFRIDMRHLLGHTAEFWDFSEELTDLAEVVINTAYHLIAEDLRSLHGTPRLEDGSVSQMAAVALGKCGGRELGFASDIELMFVYADNPSTRFRQAQPSGSPIPAVAAQAGQAQTDGPERIATSVFHEKVVSHFLNAIHARQEGIFQVDLQLRPYGKAGSLSVSLEAFKRYYAPEGPAWAYERQALVKLRPIAGDEALGKQLCALRDEFVYNGAPFDVTAMRAMRERQVRHLAAAGKFNAKYSPGGLVDIEYLIQGLQITHGAGNPALRQTNIREAMAALCEAGILSEADYTKLRKAHTFLRWLIDAMRMVRGNAKDITVPSFGSEEFAFLARRLRYGNDINQLREDLLRYQTDVQEINRRLLM